MCFGTVCTAQSFFRRAQNIGLFYAVVPSKGSTKVLAALKISSDAVKPESLFRGFLAHVSACDSTASATLFQSLSHPTKLQCSCPGKHTRSVASVVQLASRTRSPGFVNVNNMSFSKFTLLYSGRSTDLYPESGGCFL